MKVTAARVLWVAVFAGAAGLLASHFFDGGRWMRTDTAQRALNAAARAAAPVPPGGVVPAGIGDPLPAIVLPDMQGKPMDLRSLRGRPLLINVWASWCGPCIKEMPELDRYARAQGSGGVQVVGLALDTRQGVADFLKRVPVSYPIVLDAPGPADASVWLGNAQGVLPYTVLIGADGRLLKQRIGPFEHGEIDRWAAD